MTNKTTWQLAMLNNFNDMLTKNQKKKMLFIERGKSLWMSNHVMARGAI